MAEAAKPAARIEEVTRILNECVYKNERMKGCG